MATPRRALSQKALVRISPAFGDAGLLSSPTRGSAHGLRPEAGAVAGESTRIRKAGPRAGTDERDSGVRAWTTRLVGFRVAAAPHGKGEAAEHRRLCRLSDGFSGAWRVPILSE